MIKLVITLIFLLIISIPMLAYIGICKVNKGLAELFMDFPGKR